MTRETTSHARPAGHVSVATIAISGLSLALAAGLGALGVVDRTNDRIAGWISHGDAGKFPNHLPEWGIWLAVVVFAFGLSSAILGTPGFWRRMVLWLTAVVLVAAWAPVLSLASHAPEICAPWIATFWSGVCALFYTANHRMPCDETSPPNDPR